MPAAEPKSRSHIQSAIWLKRGRTVLSFGRYWNQLPNVSQKLSFLSPCSMPISLTASTGSLSPASLYRHTSLLIINGFDVRRSSSGLLIISAFEEKDREDSGPRKNTRISRPDFSAEQFCISGSGEKNETVIWFRAFYRELESVAARWDFHSVDVKARKKTRRFVSSRGESIPKRLLPSDPLSRSLSS